MERGREGRMEGGGGRVGKKGMGRVHKEEWTIKVESQQSRNTEMVLS